MMKREYAAPHLGYHSLPLHGILGGSMQESLGLGAYITHGWELGQSLHPSMALAKVRMRVKQIPLSDEIGI